MSREVIEIVKLEEFSPSVARLFCCGVGMGAWGKGLAFEAPCPTLSPREAAEASFAINAGLSGFLFLFAFRLLGSCLAHGLAAQLDAMSVVHEPVEDTVGDGGIADLLMPLDDGNL